MKYSITKKTARNPLLILGAFLLLFSSVFYSLLTVTTTNAADTSKFRAGNIISESIFTNYGSMSAAKIQSFLNSKVASCDTNGTKPASEFGRPDLTHAQYAASRGWDAPPYTCLKDYSQGGKSAAQIIYEKAQHYQINPQVLIVLLQKEQSLVTDTWPLKVQYQSATGYACPDTAPCDSQYYGFTNQVDWAAKMFRAILNDSPTWYTPYELGYNDVQYSPNGSCGSSTVNIQNRATQALYNYTPYQPNAASLSAGYGDAPGDCDSHGNRNFYLYFSDWFGSTTASYDASLVSTTIYSDPAMTTSINPSSTNLTPGQTVYIRTIGKNVGSQSWNNSFVRVAAVDARNRTNSSFANDSWLATSRPTNLKESSVTPTQNGTFEFSVTMPNDIGTFAENFGLVAENKTWMDSEKISLSFTVAASQSYAAHIISTKVYYDSGHTQQILDPGKLDLRPDTKLYVQLLAKNIGSTAWNNTFARVATADSRGHTDSPFLSDDWFSTSRPGVLADTSTASGSIGTYNFTIKMPSDGEGLIDDSFGLVAESRGWMDTEIAPIVLRVYPLSSTLWENRRMYPGETITTNTGYRLIFQGDGNLVIYNRSGKAIWSSRTAGKSSDSMIMQNGGNLVMYDRAGKAIWYSSSKATSPSRMVFQGDGNLVIYGNNGKPVWSTGTSNK